MAKTSGKDEKGRREFESGPIRVMVVDDSAVVRALFTRVLESDPDIVVAASVAHGQMAINALPHHAVDVVLLDIDMPTMDGMTALPRLIEADPSIKVIMASTLTRKNADVTLRALAAGAADYVSKPTSTGEISANFDFKRELVEKVGALGAARRAARSPGRAAAAEAAAQAEEAPRLISLRPAPAVVPEIIAIGSSTGGPQALFAILSDLKSRISQPILIAQHMPPTFTTILAEHIGRLVDRPCAEAVDGEPVRPGRIYVAPGNFHMVVEAAAQGEVVRLDGSPPENHCRPAVDPTLRSAAAAYGNRTLAVILTGMGQDGLRGSERVVEAGGTVIAQDEATSVVWGMPGAVATAGLCSAVLPLPAISGYIHKLVMRPAA